MGGEQGTTVLALSVAAAVFVFFGVEVKAVADAEVLATSVVLACLMVAAGSFVRSLRSGVVREVGARAAGDKFFAAPVRLGNGGRPVVPLARQAVAARAVPAGRLLRRGLVVSRATEQEQVKGEKSAPAPDGGSTGHVVSGMPTLSEEEQAAQERIAEHQKNAPRLSPAEDLRSLVQYNHGFAVISTNSKSLDGFPSGSVVGFAPDELGRPVFVFSGMSGHTQDLLVDDRASLTVADGKFKGAADGRVNLVGNVTRVPQEEVEALKTLYRAKHPGAFWVNFGDFTWFRMTEMKAIRYVAGFARAGTVTVEEYQSAQPDPISAFASPVMKHMNDDHSDATMAMVRHFIGFPATSAEVVGLDRLGMYVKCDGGPMGAAKLRLPFPRPAADRKDVKDLIVEMTQAASAAS